MKKYLSIFIFGTLVACNSNPSIKEMTTRMGDTGNIEIRDMRSIVRNGLLTVQATIKNTSNSNLVSYRFKWINKNGMSVFDDEAWKPITLSKGQVMDLVGIAPTPDATDFRIELNQYK